MIRCDTWGYFRGPGRQEHPEGQATLEAASAATWLGQKSAGAVTEKCAKAGRWGDGEMGRWILSPSPKALNEGTDVAPEESEALDTDLAKHSNMSDVTPHDTWHFRVFRSIVLSLGETAGGFRRMSTACEDTTHASSSSRSHLPGTEAKEPEVGPADELHLRAQHEGKCLRF